MQEGQKEVKVLLEIKKDNEYISQWIYRINCPEDLQKKILWELKNEHIINPSFIKDFNNGDKYIRYRGHFKNGSRLLQEEIMRFIKLGSKELEVDCSKIRYFIDKAEETPTGVISPKTMTFKYFTLEEKLDEISRDKERIENRKDLKRAEKDEKLKDLDVLRQEVIEAFNSPRVITYVGNRYNNITCIY